MPSQQSSFRGTRTTCTFHEAIAETLAWSDGPSKMPQPWTQAYSVPERLTPLNWTGVPAASTIWSPETRTAGAGAERADSSRGAGTTTIRAATESAARRRRDVGGPPSVSGMGQGPLSNRAHHLVSPLQKEPRVLSELLRRLDVPAERV